MKKITRSLVFSLWLIMSMLTTALPAKADPTDPAAVGSWGAPFDLGMSVIHAALLHTGKVLAISYPDLAPGRALGSEAIIWDPTTGTFSDASLQTERDMFCAAHSFLPDGRLFVTGGHVKGTPNAEERGINDTFLFDPSTSAWSAGPTMSYARWYPTNVQLADGKTLIFAGKENSATTITAVESYDPATNALIQLPDSASKVLPVYPRMLLTTTGKIFLAGPSKGTQYFNPQTNAWSWVGNMIGGPRNNGNAVLLPGLNKVLAVGGKATSVTNTAEIIDLSVTKPVWRLTGSMHNARHHANAVLLADGTVLAVGGGQGGSYEVAKAVKTAEIFDPVTETWTPIAAQAAPRIYHSTALLLPDGRVLSAGMDSGTQKFTGEVYSPPYLFKGPRPTITSAPSSLGYGQQFTVSTPDATGIQRVALVKPGSVTHSTDFSQRYVDVPFTAVDGNLTVTSPPNGNHAPTGWYMLFIVNSSGVPSVASWVHVG